jgi:hypothetical protein
LVLLIRLRVSKNLCHLLFFITQRRGFSNEMDTIGSTTKIWVDLTDLFIWPII